MSILHLTKELQKITKEHLIKQIAGLYDAYEQVKTYLNITISVVVFCGIISVSMPHKSYSKIYVT
jgi:hypothetical protein